MSYKRKAKKKADLRENPEQEVDTSMGRYYLKMGLVKIIDKQNKTIRTKDMTTKQITRCHNCKYAGKPFRAYYTTHVHCYKPEYEAMNDDGNPPSPWETLRVFSSNCDDFVEKEKKMAEIKAMQKQALIDTMRGDEEIGLYDDNPKKSRI